MNKKGFTLLETILVMAITSFLAVGATQILTSTIKIQSFTLTNQSMIDQASFMIETMSRDIRLAAKDYRNECGIITDSKPGSFNGGGAEIKFMTQRDQCVRYYMDSSDPDNPILMVEKFTTSTSGVGWPDDSKLIYRLPLNSGEFKINNLDFQVQNEVNVPAAKQPRVTIFLGLESKTQKESKMQLQTTVSLRNENK